MEDAIQLGIYGADEDCNFLTFGGRRTNWKTNPATKKQDELTCARRFCGAVHPELTALTEIQQDSEIDILAQSPDKRSTLNLQVTSVWPEDFWKPLASGAVDKRISRKELADLMHTAIEKKKQKRSSSRDVALLLDTHPVGIDARCLSVLRAATELLKEIAGDQQIFAEIWLVDPNGTVRIS